MTNMTALRNHLSNVIYIENNFGLDLFKTEINITKDDTDDFEDAIMMRQEPSLVANESTASEENLQSNEISISDFFSAVQRHNSDVNIMPYYYDSSMFWNQTHLLKKKLSHFPLIIIDWQLEENDSPKTGMDVFEEIIKDNQILHYYVIYSNEISKAITSFSEKFTDIKFGEIKEDGIAVIDNAIVMFANKRTRNIDDIISALENFTIMNYGYLPQQFLSIKQQIENKTAALYNNFMGMDSIMLPQLVMDEAYDYDGMQEEIISSILINKLRSELVIDKQKVSYGHLVLQRLLNTKFSKETYETAIKSLKKPPKEISYEICNERIKQILDSKCLKEFDFISLKNAAQIFFSGDIKETFDVSWPEHKKNAKRKEQIWSFILFLSICCDEKYYDKYLRLLSLIKLTIYQDSYCWTLQDCEDDVKAKALCQGDVFINETSDSFLLCITPSCQLIRPDKINATYTFLKGCFSKTSADSKQKQIFSTHLINRDKNQVVLVNWEFFSPVVIDLSKKGMITNLSSYMRCYRLNMEYTHKIIELYSEYIKQIGVEEMFGKRVDDKEKELFLEVKGDCDDSN